MTCRLNSVLLFTALLLTACGGSGAGDVINDSGQNTAGPRLVDRFVGVWQLTSSWSSNATDEALLVIREPDSRGRAEILLYDFTDEADIASQCYRPPFGNGDAFDSLTNEVFVDNFDVFSQGILTAAGNNNITVSFVDANDVNGNNNTSERLNTTLSRSGIVESDISPLCTN